MSTSSLTASIIFGAISAFALVCLPFLFLRARRLARHGATTVGTVTEMREAHEGYTAHVLYDVGGTAHQLQSDCSDERYEVGDQVKIRYLPDRPAEAVLDEHDQLWLRPIGAALMVVLFAIGAVVFFLGGCSSAS